MAKTSGFSNATMRSFRLAVAQINHAAKQIKDETGSSIRMFAEEILTDVKDSRPGHGVPVDTGALRGTGQVKSEGKKHPKVSIAFGGPAAPYALVQHEVLKFHHTVGESRYLVRGLERWRPELSAAYASFKTKVNKIVKKS